ncbi:MAG: hypothetical protein ABL884_02735 [Methyloglobulus sp.]
MRRYGRFFMALIVVSVSAWVSLPIFFAQAQEWFKYVQSADSHTLSTTANNSLVYPIKPKQWLTFALPEESPQLRIITNAHIQRKDAAALVPNWAYALHYEFLDKKGVVLTSGVYNQRSQLTTYKDEQGELSYNNYYSNKELVPLDGRLILLGLQGMKRVTSLRVSLEATNPAIVEAAVRVYVPAKIAKQQLMTEWLRMGKAQKDNLAKNSIYPASLLSLAEKKNLVSHQWQALGPMGIEGKSYRTLTLYTLKDKEEEVAVQFTSGLQADGQHYAVIPLPERGGQVGLTFKALDGSALTTPIEIDLQWFGRDNGQRWQQNAVWSKDSDNLSYSLDGGLLVIRPSSPVIVNASLTTATEPKHDISDALLSVKTYRTSFGVDFDVLHYQQQAAALRVDVRNLLTTAQQLQHEPVRYQWLDDKQQIIASGELNALQQASHYDRIGSIAEPENVSEPLSYYFHLPPQVAKLRLLANAPSLLVSAYNQPYGLTKTQRVPEDIYVAHDASDGMRDQQLAWFPLRAANDKNLMQQQAVQWISGQYHPPEDNPDVLAGRYLWQDYIPQGEASAHYLLTEYTEDEPRTDALPSVYCALAVNQDTQVKLEAFAGLRRISPELIFLRNDTKPFHAELFFNQQKVAAMDAMGQQGVIHPPETNLGNQQYRLNTDSGGRWLMNYQAQCKGERYLKRRVFALNADAPQNFVIQHSQEDEVFSARLYSPNNTVERSQIKVDITAITANAPRASVATSWTYTNRLYDIRPLPTKAMPILYTQGQTLSNGERFSIPLNSDLPAGAYQIRMALANGAAGYILLSQIKAGVHEQRRFYRESQLEAR